MTENRRNAGRGDARNTVLARRYRPPSVPIGRQESGRASH